MTADEVEKMATGFNSRESEIFKSLSNKIYGRVFNTILSSQLTDDEREILECHLIDVYSAYVNSLTNEEILQHANDKGILS